MMFSLFVKLLVPYMGWEILTEPKNQLKNPVHNMYNQYWIRSPNPHLTYYKAIT